MRKIVFTVVVLCMAMFSVNAQDVTEKKLENQKPHKAGMENMLDELKTELQLNDEQSAQLELIKAKYKPMIDDVRKDTDGSRETKMKKSREIFDRVDKEIEDMLNAEQKELWKAYKEKRQQNRQKEGRGRGQGRRGGGGRGM